MPLHSLHEAVLPYSRLRRSSVPLLVIALAARPFAEPPRQVRDPGSGPEQQAATANPVAVLETRTPRLPEFLLRGTVPVPPGTFPRADGLNPFSILDYDGSPVV